MSSTTNKRMLDALTALSHTYGADDFVVGGGGNTSCKTSRTLWVKPSGTSLANMSPTAFVSLDRSRLAALYDIDPPASPRDREAMVSEQVGAAVKRDSPGRPSVEAPLHDTLAYRFVVHVHPPLVNGLTCSRDGESACRRLFPEVLWIPYCDPGYTLCMRVRDAIGNYTRTRGVQPAVIMLQNHGIFVGGDAPEDIHGRFEHVLRRLHDTYAQANISLTVTPRHAPPEATARTIQSHWPEPGEIHVFAAGPMPVAEGPLTPDHIVYGKAVPLFDDPTPEAVTAFRVAHGYLPRIVATPTALFAIGGTVAESRLVFDIARDGALVRQLSQAFGGPRYMDDTATAFIENWEAESYRQSINTPSPRGNGDPS